MNILTIIPIALALAMDAFAVSISAGITSKESKLKTALIVALFFGTFQAIMPVIGWLAGNSLVNFISEIDHWLAFGLLCLIGCRMIYESFNKDHDKNIINSQNLYILFLLAIATSIDALAVGITFAFLDVSILFPVIIIGTITFVLSFSGVIIGKKLGELFKNRILIVGGIILILIGLNIVIEHL